MSTVFYDWTTHYTSPPVHMRRVTDFENCFSTDTVFAKIDLRDGFITCV